MVYKKPRGCNQIYTLGYDKELHRESEKSVGHALIGVCQPRDRLLENKVRFAKDICWL